jgi:uncharacterized protein (UPF0335 family)
MASPRLPGVAGCSSLVDETLITSALPFNNLFIFNKKQRVSTMQKLVTGGVEAPKLRSYIERVERLEEEKKGIASDISDVMSEAKSNGFDVKAIRQILKLRKMKANERTEAEYMLELYKRALGMDNTLDALDEEAA